MILPKKASLAGINIIFFLILFSCFSTFGMIPSLAIFTKNHCSVFWANSAKAIFKEIVNVLLTI